MPERRNRVELRMHRFLLLRLFILADQRPPVFALGVHFQQQLEFRRQVVGWRLVPDFLPRPHGKEQQQQDNRHRSPQDRPTPAGRSSPPFASTQTIVVHFFSLRHQCRLKRP